MAMTEEERKAKNAAKQRAFRARKAAARAEAKREAVTADEAGEVPRTMRDAVEESLKHAKWLRPSDEASMAQARDLARMVDLLNHAGNHSQAMSAHRTLSRVLSDIGATPTGRIARELRSLSKIPDEPGKAVTDGGAGDGEPEGRKGNVSKFERPKPRRSA